MLKLWVRGYVLRTWKINKLSFSSFCCREWTQFWSLFGSEVGNIFGHLKAILLSAATLNLVENLSRFLRPRPSCPTAFYTVGHEVFLRSRITSFIFVMKSYEIIWNYILWKSINLWIFFIDRSVIFPASKLWFENFEAPQIISLHS